MLPTPITDHADQAISRLIEHFSGPNKPALYGMIRSLVAQIQELEDVGWDVVFGRMLDPAPGETRRAVGAQLDVLGKIVGLKRGGLDDDKYRLGIRLQILVNRSYGRTRDLMKIVRTAIGVAGEIAAYREEHHHVYYVRLEEIPDWMAVMLGRALQRARAAGYRAMFEYFTDRVDASRVARFGWSGDAGVGNGGFGWSGDDSLGGLMTSIQG